MKEKGTQLFEPEKGRSYGVFNKRPLSDVTAPYYVQDVTFLPVLWLVHAKKMTKSWWSKIEQETKMKVSRSQAAIYNVTGQHMAQVPSGWMHWITTDHSMQFLDSPVLSLKPSEEIAARPA